VGKKSSKAPDLEKAAQAQGVENEKVWNMQNFADRGRKINPYGTEEYTPYSTVNPATGETMQQWEQNTTLNPEFQSIFDAQTRTQGTRTDLGETVAGRLKDDYSQGVDWSEVGDWGDTPEAQRSMGLGGNVGDPNDYRQRGEDASYNKAMSRLNPRFKEESRALEQQMRNQGLQPSDRAWQDAMDTTSRGQNDATDLAIWGASEAGREESALNFGQDLSRNRNTFDQGSRANADNFGRDMATSQYSNQLRKDQGTELQQRRGSNLNELNAIISGQQVSSPQFANMAQGGGPAAAPLYQASIDGVNADAASQQGFWGGLGDLAGAGLGAYGMAQTSDRRLKTNIKRIGTVKGYPWYSFDYIWGESSQGVMADEVPEEFTTDIGGGYKGVYYGPLLGE
jgi:hypothetical protein